MSQSTYKEQAAIIYDGECPFCHRYIAMVRLKDSIGPVRLINAREGGALVERLVSDGYDLDEGMVLLLNGNVYHGDDCIHHLALMTTPSGWFNRFNAWTFSSKRRSRFLYPIMKFGRNVTLRLMGRKKLQSVETAHPQIPLSEKP